MLYLQPSCKLGKSNLTLQRNSPVANWCSFRWFLRCEYCFRRGVHYAIEQPCSSLLWDFAPLEVLQGFCSLLTIPNLIWTLHAGNAEETWGIHDFCLPWRIRISKWEPWLWFDQKMNVSVFPRMSWMMQKYIYIQYIYTIYIYIQYIYIYIYNIYIYIHTIYIYNIYIYIQYIYIYIQYIYTHTHEYLHIYIHARAQYLKIFIPHLQLLLLDATQHRWNRPSHGSVLHEKGTCRPCAWCGANGAFNSWLPSIFYPQWYFKWQTWLSNAIFIPNLYLR